MSEKNNQCALCDLTPFQYTALEMGATRREFIQLAVSLALASLGGRTGARGSTNMDHNEVLPDVVYQLFPHSGLSKDVYEQVTEQLGVRIEQSGELTAMLDEALETLAENTGRKWPELADGEQTAWLVTIQHTAFFQFVRNETLNGIYRHPLTWELLGFEGSSLEFGGYINRGFNDIDWLPDQSNDEISSE